MAFFFRVFLLRFTCVMMMYIRVELLLVSIVRIKSNVIAEYDISFLKKIISLLYEQTNKKYWNLCHFSVILYWIIHHCTLCMYKKLKDMITRLVQKCKNNCTKTNFCLCTYYPTLAVTISIWYLLWSNFINQQVMIFFYFLGLNVKLAQLFV